VYIKAKYKEAAKEVINKHKQIFNNRKYLVTNISVEDSTGEVIHLPYKQYTSKCEWFAKRNLLSEVWERNISSWIQEEIKKIKINKKWFLVC